MTVGKLNSYVDYRLGGKARYYLSPPGKDINVRIPDTVLKCVTFIGRKEDETIEYRGTGFFVVVEHNEEGTGFEFGYLVTAKHIADAIEKSPFYIRVNLRTGIAEDVLMNDVGRPTAWYRHPNDPDADIAITPVRIPQEVDALSIPCKEMIINETKREDLAIGIGDEAFLIGLFSRLKGETKNIPISRIGNIAMFPDEKIPARDHQGRVRKIRAFLVEARSIGGLSGSPVFARPTTYLRGVVRTGTNTPGILTAYSSEFYLIGLVSAHWDIDPADINHHDPKIITGGVNLGFAVVAPSYQILDILESDELIQMRKQAAKKAVEEKKEQGAATLDWGAVKHEGGEEQLPFTQAEFEAALKKVARKIEPEKPK